MLFGLCTSIVHSCTLGHRFGPSEAVFFFTVAYCHYCLYHSVVYFWHELNFKYIFCCVVCAIHMPKD
jgi:hypothetical protein